MALAAYINAVATDPVTIDTTLVDSLISLAKSCMGLFAEYPLNVILIGSLCGVAFGLIAKAKRTAK